MSSSAVYDVVLFGVTGFTGKLALEHLLTKHYPISWACCARNEAKAQALVKSIANGCGVAETPPIEVADLVCTTTAQEATLRAVVKKARVVITTAGPFEKYGQTLVKLCAEEGVSYADITGESDFFRSMIAQHDATARRTGATIVIHCGNDCIPWDLTVFEMHELARRRGGELVEVSTYTEYPPGTGASGGTLTTAVYQLGKKRSGAAKGDFDPLLRTPSGSKSTYATKVTSPKRDVWVPEFNTKGGPWIMSPVMANCVRRSNALLQYSPSFAYSEAQLRNATLLQWCKDTGYQALVGAAIYMPFVFQRFLPQPGEGPSREVMDNGWLTVHGRGRMVLRKAADGAATQTVNLVSKFHFRCAASLIKPRQSPDRAPTEPRKSPGRAPEEPRLLSRTQAATRQQHPGSTSAAPRQPPDSRVLSGCARAGRYYQSINQSTPCY